MSSDGKINKPLTVGAVLSGIPMGIIGGLLMCFSLSVFSLAPVYALLAIITFCLMYVGFCSFMNFACIGLRNKTEENDYSLFSIIKDFSLGFLSGIICSASLIILSNIVSADPSFAIYFNISLLDAGIAVVGFVGALFLPKIGNAILDGVSYVGKMAFSAISNLFTFTREGIGSLLTCCFSRKQQKIIPFDMSEKQITHNKKLALPIIYPPLLLNASVEKAMRCSSANQDEKQNIVHPDRVNNHS